MTRREQVKKASNILFKILVVTLLAMSIYCTLRDKNKQKYNENCDKWFRTEKNNDVLRICYDPFGRCERLDIAFDRSGFFISIPYTVIRKMGSELPEGNFDMEFNLQASCYNQSITTTTENITRKILFDDSLANCPEFSRLSLLNFETIDEI